MTPSELAPIDTPALLIDLDVLARNLAWMQEKADRHGVALRLHIKTHKIPELALMQVRLGACGVTTAKIAEAEVMAATMADNTAERASLGQLSLTNVSSSICSGVILGNFKDFMFTAKI